MSKYKYIIGTGWYSSEDNNNRHVYGDDFIRSQGFQKLWFRSIKSFTTPLKIVMVDSNSPVPPLIDPNSKVELITLNENGGHASNINGKYCGWMRGVINGLTYALSCDCDYYVYVEQDCLLYGHDIIEEIIENMNCDYAFGESVDYSHPLQQSLFIIKRTAIEEFLSNIYRIPYSDYEMSCEIKFALASSKLFKFIPVCFYKLRFKGLIYKVLYYFQRRTAKFIVSSKLFKTKYGRDRPLDFSLNNFYFQHGSDSEVKQYIEYTKS